MALVVHKRRIGEALGACQGDAWRPRPAMRPARIHFFFTDGGPTVAGTNPAVVAVFARALTTFSQRPLLLLRDCSKANVDHEYATAKLALLGLSLIHI